MNVLYEASSRNMRHLTGWSVVLLGLLIWLVLHIGSFGVLWSGSHLAVNHDLHAIELTDGRFIHGSTLTCSQIDQGFDCETLISSELLSIQTHQLGNLYGSGLPRSIEDCTATFAGAAIDCQARTVTDSVFAHGVILSDENLLEAVSADSSTTSNWRNVFLGRFSNVALSFSAWGFATWSASTVIYGVTIYRRLLKAKTDLVTPHTLTTVAVLEKLNALHISLHIALSLMLLPLSLVATFIASFVLDYLE